MAINMDLDMNAVGYGDQDLESDRGGNNSRGVLDQVRPTGLLFDGRGGKGMQGDRTGLLPGTERSMKRKSKRGSSR